MSCFKPPSHFMAAMTPVTAQKDLRRKLAAAFSHYTAFLDGKVPGRPTPLVYGPSGSGKTFAVELCCQASGLPYSVIGGGGVSAAGYKGVTLRDMLAMHYLRFRKSEGVIFMDEIDKWTRGAMKTADNEQLAMGQNKMAEMLRYVENEDVYLLDEAKDSAGLREEDPDDPDSEDPDSWLPASFQTRRAMWVLAGAFDGLHHLVQRRLQQDTLMEESQLWERVAPADLRAYGVLPELVNRCDVTAWVNPLKGCEIIEILEAQEVPQQVALFEAIGCRLVLDSGALARVAHLAVQEKTGARGAVLRLRHTLTDCFTEADELQLTTAVVTAHVLDTGHLPVSHQIDGAA